jgi:hypothetical protein
MPSLVRSGVELFAPGVLLNGLRARHAGPGSVDQCGAFVGTEQVAQQHQWGVIDRMPAGALHRGARPVSSAGALWVQAGGPVQGQGVGTRAVQQKLQWQ